MFQIYDAILHGFYTASIIDHQKVEKSILALEQVLQA
jgi:hypothetical protein